MSTADIPGGPHAMPSFDDEMAEILESFLVETREIFERLGQDLLTLEKSGGNPELLNSIFRAVHTVKGTSSFLGLEQMTSLAHRYEDVLNKLRKGELAVSPDKMDVLFEAFDMMKLLLQKIEARQRDPVNLSGTEAKLVAMSQGGPAPGPKAPAPEAVPAETPTSARAATAEKVVDSTIRVDVGRLDGLMNLVGELVLGRNRLTQIAQKHNEEYEGSSVAKELLDTSAQIDFITTELQTAVMKTRMIPIGKVFNRLPRLMRDLMKETGKEIDLQISGEETELDKTIIEELNDPLVHILRNSADHGIETPEERRAAGKPAMGIVRVTAEHEGNLIVITVTDDGHGMDPEILKAKAIEKGLVTEEQAGELSRRDALNLIFAPGFSTATKVTNVSGRGVGMDVVRTNIGRLKGMIDIESEPGAGSTFIIKLPLTLAIIQALLVEASREIYCIPLGSVLEIIRVRTKDIATINGREVVQLRNSVLPLARIARVLGSSSNGHDAEWLYIVVIGLAEQRLGIVVENMLGQKEVVIKSLGGYLGTVQGIAGSTILGDGRVIMIIDVGEFMKLSAVRR